RGNNRWEEVIEQSAHATDAGKQSWETLVDRLVEYNRSVGVGGPVLDKLRNAKDGGVRFVLTGQQPGVLGGSMLTLYKVMTAIAVSNHVEKTFNVPCVPLHWVGADDVDFQEIRELFLVDCDLTPLSTAIAHDTYQAAAPVGDIAAQAIRDVWEAVEPLVSRCPHGEYVSGIVDDALDDATDHGFVTARIIAELTGGRAALIDGRDPAVRVHARELFLRFFDQEEQVRELVAASGRSLEEAGYHAQLRLGPDSGVFMVEEGRRKKIVDEKRQDVRTHLAEDVGRFSPGVALRNLVQDSVFRPVAAVLGPAEIAYRAQLDQVYDAMDVGRPVAFPRMQASY
ncbi:MAG: bacillithiol biosynthesis BshC, partial [Candidatus Krumholzibacteria bacterium]|nr:bacillithiol biosynthesis BshC [Candidatus Krumholzibacteria bacterium]